MGLDSLADFEAGLLAVAPRSDWPRLPPAALALVCDLCCSLADAFALEVCCRQLHASFGAGPFAGGWWLSRLPCTTRTDFIPRMIR